MTLLLLSGRCLQLCGLQLRLLPKESRRAYILRSFRQRSWREQKVPLRSELFTRRSSCEYTQAAGSGSEFPLGIWYAAPGKLLVNVGGLHTLGNLGERQPRVCPAVSSAVTRLSEFRV